MSRLSEEVISRQKVISTTESVCPQCLRHLPAQRTLRSDTVYLEKTCPQHGDFRTVVWRGAPPFDSWVRPKIPAYPKNPLTPLNQGCPYDCGLCPDHRQQTCSVLFEVTQRCDLRCPVCFADAGKGNSPDPGLDFFEAWYHRLLATGGPFNVQLSGGEPCLREDLAEIITLGRSLGFTHFQLNTNGLRLARDPEYLRRLVQAGLSTVFLQFDSTRDEPYLRLRGRPLLAQKLAAIENCAAQGVGVVLVPTLVPGVNDSEIGEIIRFALERMPAVRGVHFQPVSYFGRYPRAPRDADRLTLPEVMQAIEEQTQGQVRMENLCPPGCEHALCSFHGNFVYMEDGKLAPLSHNPQEGACCQPEDAARGAARSRAYVSRFWSAPMPADELPVLGGPGFGGWDSFLQRSRTHTFCISAMAFQDAWNLDLERLKGCCIHIAGPDGHLVPFCAYNLTSQSGRSLYRGNGGPEAGADLAA